MNLLPAEAEKVQISTLVFCLQFIALREINEGSLLQFVLEIHQASHKPRRSPNLPLRNLPLSRTRLPEVFWDVRVVVEEEPPV